MNNFLRTIIAGYGAKKLGGGCFSTILVFILIYWALGTCNRQPAQRTSSIQKSSQIAFKNPLQIKATANFTSFAAIK